MSRQTSYISQSSLIDQYLVEEENRINKLAYWERFVGVFAVMINVYGAIIMRDLK